VSLSKNQVTIFGRDEWDRPRWMLGMMERGGSRWSS